MYVYVFHFGYDSHRQDFIIELILNWILIETLKSILIEWNTKNETQQPESNSTWYVRKIRLFAAFVHNIKYVETQKDNKSYISGRL